MTEIDAIEAVTREQGDGLTMAKLELARKVLLNAPQIRLIIRFKKHLWFQPVYMHHAPTACMIIENHGFRFQIEEIHEWDNRIDCYCYKLTRSKFTPQHHGWERFTPQAEGEVGR